MGYLSGGDFSVCLSAISLALNTSRNIFSAMSISELSVSSMIFQNNLKTAAVIQSDAECIGDKSKKL